MKKINRNFFKSFMFICVGLMAVMLMSAVNLCDPPGPPGQPKVIDYGIDWCTIQFTPPTHDGGSPICGYLVDYRYRGEVWKPFTKKETPILAYKIKIPDLKAGKEIEFRVSAVSTEGGEGPYSASSEPHIIREK
ncbi:MULTISPECIES: fibronectin type III domain-containing protein [Butyricimonas]|uniref:fibronectin type III domain-containing protein n=1 Tax=Butyricimonas TaxID=574697 RepID=UPI0007FB408B|nr:MULTISPECIES: fibronectin type III domain-containing protein [Butyricimonas]